MNVLWSVKYVDERQARSCGELFFENGFVPSGSVRIHCLWTAQECIYTMELVS